MLSAYLSLSIVVYFMYLGVAGITIIISEFDKGITKFFLFIGLFIGLGFPVSILLAIATFLTLLYCWNTFSPCIDKKFKEWEEKFK